MTISLAVIPGGRHAGRVINARLRRENRGLKKDNRELLQRAEGADVYVHEARMRACQDAMTIARLTADRDEYAAAVKRMEEQHGETVRGMERHIAELARRLELRSKTEAVVTKTQPIPTFFAAAKLASTSPARVPTQPVPVITRVEPAS